MILCGVLPNMVGTYSVKYSKQYDKWVVYGGNQSLQRSPTKSNAVDMAKKIAEQKASNQGTQTKLKVYKKNGALQNTFNYESKEGNPFKMI